MIKYLQDRFSKEKISSFTGLLTLVLALLSGLGYLSGAEFAAIQTVLSAAGFDLGDASMWSTVAGAVLVLFPTSWFKKGTTQGDALILVLCFFVVGFSIEDANAEPISTHNEQHVGEIKGIHLLMQEGCALPDLKRKAGFRLEKDQDGYRLIGNEIAIVCVKWVEETKSHAILITWSHATTRENGTGLGQSEIAGYDICHNGTYKSPNTPCENGVLSEVGVVTQVTFTDVDEGTHTFFLRTRDTNGLVSKPSQIFSVEVKS